MKNNRKSRAIVYISFTYIILVMLITIGTVFFLKHKLQVDVSSEEQQLEEYKKHYVMISEDKDIIDAKIYESTLEEAKKNEAYVEHFGKNLSLSIGKQQLLKMAIDSSVDGIFLLGDDSLETRNLINESVIAGVPVITFGEDSSESSRQCFVGVTSYSYGTNYGIEILELIKLRKDKLKEGVRIGLLVDENSLSTNQNVILAIRSYLDEKLGASYNTEIQVIPVDNKSTFSVEDNIRDILLDKPNIPDILLCMDEVYAECVYRAMVDYNMVGKIDVIGYGTTDTIVNAVIKNIFYSTVYFDTNQMGNLCVQALVEYQRMGYVSSYMPVNTVVIHKEDAIRLVEEAKKE